MSKIVIISLIGNTSRRLIYSELFGFLSAVEMRAGIKAGDYDNVADCRYRVPTHWDIGKVFQRLIVDVFPTRKAGPCKS